MKYILDTSFVLGYINPQDSNHTKVMQQVAEIQFYEDDEIYISDCIYAELLTVTKRKKNTYLLPTLYKTIEARKTKNISTNLRIFLGIYQKIETYCSVQDISVILHALEYNAIILSCDEELIETAYSLGYEYE